ncbi:bactofilin family protein [Treponema pectinovorum]|uniref:bactofilin family protein n=1 Tax=Treponema pectinovorum TaxID=164 RepID=UPI0011CB68E5|nr:polymer-forming cytoskeletal protein [Treponema pectinovorum]
MAFTSDDISINTVIGKGSSILGDVKINGFIRIDGDIKGEIQTSSNVIVGDTARIQGNISASSIIIGGIIVGNVVAPKGIKLLANSVLIGDVSTKSLQVAENVIFNGHCISLGNDDEYQSSSIKFQDQKIIQSKVI